MFHLSPIVVFPHSNLLLHDAGLEEMIKRGKIKIVPKPGDVQRQPASLDIRIGMTRVYDAEAQAQTARHWNKHHLAKPSVHFAKIFPDEKDIPIDIPPKSFTELFFHEQPYFESSRFDLGVDLRSSRGRLGLSLASQETEKGNRQYVSFWNMNPNTIRLYGQDPFTQLFFYPKRGYANGHIVQDPDEAKELVQGIADAQMYGAYIMFFVGDHVRKFREDIGIIDTREKYADEVLYRQFSAEEGCPVFAEDAVIMQLHPRVKLPPNLGIRILHCLPYAQISGLTKPSPEYFFLESHVANAGWVDPGYEGFVTAHPIRRKFPAVYTKGDFIALGALYHYDTPVKRPYGSSTLNSHYQKSDGVGARS
ncbi:hypothetical protein C4573_04630 [Candidatus Woesearchaeota archaeon]|nr:MAG: hypothetical protein C4573_04630 [Candidatus Woesearchaeota archaeon]